MREGVYGPFTLEPFSVLGEANFSTHAGGALVLMPGTRPERAHPGPLALSPNAETRPVLMQQSLAITCGIRKEPRNCWVETHRSGKDERQELEDV